MTLDLRLILLLQGLIDLGLVAAVVYILLHTSNSILSFKPNNDPKNGSSHPSRIQDFRQIREELEVFKRDLQRLRLSVEHQYRRLDSFQKNSTHNTYTIPNDHQTFEKNNNLESPSKLPESKESSSSTKKLRKKILDLDKKGLDAKTIARQLEIPTGEVELIINLNRQTDFL